MPNTPDNFDATPPAPVDTPEITVGADPTAGYRRIGDIKAQQVLAAVNAQAAPSLEANPLPVLTETQNTGYVNGVPSPVTLVKIGWSLVEKFTGYDFLYMQAAAKKVGIALLINNGFRDMATQQKLYAERWDTTKKIPVLSALGKTAGPAAEPGYSNHQSGIAVDLNVGMTIAQRLSGVSAYSPTFKWLQAHAAEFGFDNLDIPKDQPEPWHWVHRERRIVTAQVLIKSLTNPLSADATAAFVVSTARPAQAIYASKDLYDREKAFTRSNTAANSTRDDHMGAHAARAIMAGASVANTAGQLGNVITQTINRMPIPFDTATTKAVTFDFATGRWGNEEKAT